MIKWFETGWNHCWCYCYGRGVNWGGMNHKGTWEGKDRYHIIHYSFRPVVVFDFDWEDRFTEVECEENRRMAAYIPGRGEPIDKDAPLSSRNVSRLTTYELRQELVRRDKLDIPDDQINHRFALHFSFRQHSILPIFLTVLKYLCMYSTLGPCSNVWCNYS